MSTSGTSVPWPEFTQDPRSPEAAAFIAECRSQGTSEAAIEQAEKKGFDTGLRVAHPFIEGATLLFTIDLIAIAPR